jgi:hypothetical protein
VLREFVEDLPVALAGRPRHQDPDAPAERSPAAGLLAAGRRALVHGMSTNMDRAQLVDRITDLLLAELSGRALVPRAPASPGCPDCDAWGACPVHCMRQLESAWDAGAARAASSLGFACPADDGVRSRIDHTLLKPEATTQQVMQLCKEARENCFASVCINPTYVALCAKELAGTPVRVCTVVGFPLGAHLPEVKAYETRRAVQDGAREIDMVVNIGALKIARARSRAARYRGRGRGGGRAGAGQGHPRDDAAHARRERWRAACSPRRLAPTS